MLNPTLTDAHSFKTPAWLLWTFLIALLIGLLCLIKTHANKTDEEKIEATKESTWLSDLKTTPNKSPTVLENKIKKSTQKSDLTMDDDQVSRLRTLLLPMPHGKHATPTLLPPPNTVAQTNLPAPSQRCTYNNQTYVPGDIVKTDQGWMRCTPTIIFTPENPTTRQIGSPGWTLVQ